MRKSDHGVLILVIATGVSSVVTQIVTIREFLAQFQGNEFIIALILFSWLLLGGAGTLTARLMSRPGHEASYSKLAWISLCLAAFSPLQIYFIRLVKTRLFVFGSSVGFYPTLAYIILMIAPYCLLLGFVLPFSLYVLRAERGDYPASRIYITDNLGDLSGGALFSFVLVYLTPPIMATAVAGLFLLAAIFMLALQNEPRQKALLSGCAVVLAVLALCTWFERASINAHGGVLSEYRESRYGRIEVIRGRELFTVFLNGMPASNSQNIVEAEETVHYPLSQLKKVDDLLLISAEGGMMDEIAKYRPERLDYVELDPDMSNILFKYNILKKIPNLHVINKDAVRFLMTTRTRYDAIIMNMPEPETFQANRFYTKGFFSMVRRHLKPSGIFCFSLQGFDNYLSRAAREKISSLHKTAANYFYNILLFPGQKIYFLCRNGGISSQIPALLRGKGIKTRYISGYFRGNVTKQRIDELKALVDDKAPENLDLVPRLMGIMFFQWFEKYSTSPLPFFMILGVLSLGYLLCIKREEFVLFTTGFMTMGSEILVIFGFQIFFGYVYHILGLIITVFLAGLLPGAWMGERWRKKRKSVLMVTDLILVCLIGIYVLSLVIQGESLPLGFYLITGFLVSLVCGFQFPVALHLRGGSNSAAAGAFSADLMGAAAGTIATSVVLIPYFGVVKAGLGLAGIKLVSMVVTGGEKQ